MKANKKFIPQLHPHEHITTTYMTSTEQNNRNPNQDHFLIQAIKDANINKILEPEHNQVQQQLKLYNQQKRLHEVIIQMRNRFDVTKNQSQRLQGYLAKMDKDKESLTAEKRKIEEEHHKAEGMYGGVIQKEKTAIKAVENADYNKSVRLFMIDQYKQDLMFYKKKTLDQNIEMAKRKSRMNQLTQQSTNRNHMKSKSKIFLQSISETYNVRKFNRDLNVEKLQKLASKKNQNDELQKNREQMLEGARVNAVNEKQPSEKQMDKLIFTHLLLRKMLRHKMMRIIEENGEVQRIYNNISKRSTIQNSNDFVQRFLKRQQTYGDMLSEVESKQKRLKQQKETNKILLQQKNKIMYVTEQIENIGQDKIKTFNNSDQNCKKLNIFNDQLLKQEQLEISMRRWSIKFLIKLNNINKKNNEEENVSDLAEKYIQLNTSESMKCALNEVSNLFAETNSTITEKEDENPENPKSHHSLSTKNTSKLRLEKMNDSPLLSKEVSSKNFRIKTQQHNVHQTLNDKNDEYEQRSQQAFLKQNRKVFKKHQHKVLRVKTKPF